MLRTKTGITYLPIGTEIQLTHSYHTEYVVLGYAIDYRSAAKAKFNNLLTMPKEDSNVVILRAKDTSNDVGWISLGTLNEASIIDLGRIIITELIGEQHDT